MTVKDQNIGTNELLALKERRYKRIQHAIRLFRLKQKKQSLKKQISNSDLNHLKEGGDQEIEMAFILLSLNKKKEMRRLKLHRMKVSRMR